MVERLFNRLKKDEFGALLVLWQDGLSKQAVIRDFGRNNPVFNGFSFGKLRGHGRLVLLQLLGAGPG
jgi:hypothetical protein